MGFFSSSSPFDSCVERASSEKNTSEDWSQIMDVCDKVKESPNGAKECLKSITKRINNDNPRVALQTVTLLDACINNCGRKFLLEVAGREFEQELQKILTSSRTHLKVSQRLKESLKKWAEGEFKGDPELSLIPALYGKLQKEGYEFDFPSDSPKKTVKYSSDPNVVHSAQEEEDIAKAIQLSLRETGSNSNKSAFQGLGSQNASSGLYSSASAVLTSEGPAAPATQEKEPMKVRALYDFEAAEDNELTFKAGEIIIILDNSDANWWKGSNHRGEGLFPANFVTTDLEEEQTYKSEMLSGKRVSFSECVEVTEVDEAPSEITEATGEVDEDKIDQLLHLLHEADPTGERGDDRSLPVLEEQVNAMAPNIDAELECIDKKHAQLARISTDLVGALNLYHQLMREMPSPMPYYSPYNKVMATSGPQSILPPHYLPSNPQNMPPHPMYSAGQYPPYVGAPVSGMPQYLPPHMAPPGAPAPSGHLGSPSHHLGPSQLPTSNFQPVPHESHYNHLNQVAPPEFGGMPAENIQNMIPTSSPAPVNTPATPASLLPQGFPPNIPAQGHHIAMPPSAQAGQGNMPPQGPVMNMPPQGAPTNMTPQGPPTNVAPQGAPTNMAPQGPQASMPQQGPPPTMPPPGPPTSMPFYPQPPIQQMQQPLL